MPTFLMHKLLEASVKEEICKLVPMFLSDGRILVSLESFPFAFKLYVPMPSS